MREYIKNYIKIIAYAFTGLVFIMASFYLMINYNHSEELKKTIYIGPNNSDYQNQKQMLEKINNNLKNYKSNDSSKYNMLYNGVGICYNVLRDSGTFADISLNTYLTPVDIHSLGVNFQNKVVNKCYAINLSFLRDENSEWKEISPFITGYVNSINKNVIDALSEIENNSSYFFSTNITSATIRDYLTSDYKTITGAYIDFTEMILNLSELLKNGGNNA